MPKYFKQDLLTHKEVKDQNDEEQWDDDDQEHYGPYGYDYDPVKTLLTWHAPARPFRKKTRSYYTTAAILVILVSLIAFIASQFMLVVTLLAFLFMVYVLNFVRPESIVYKISTQGITIGDHFYHWQELDSFWFKSKDGYQILHILTLYRFPGELMLVLGGVDEDELKRVCARFIPFHEIAPKSLIEKWAESLQKHFPLETPQS